MGSLAESTSTTFKDNILQSGTESNFKYFMCDKECVSAASSRGMWIEIRKICDRRMVRSRHAPRGARVLKCVNVRLRLEDGGARHMYIPKDGISIAERSGEDWVFKTAWKSADFDEEAEKILEVIKNVGL